MRLTRLGHACLYIEDEDASVMIDPGAFSSGFEQLRRTADQLGQRGITAQVAKAGNTFHANGLSVWLFGNTQ